jgi:hypothetical protein
MGIFIIEAAKFILEKDSSIKKLKNLEGRSLISFSLALLKILKLILIMTDTIA